ncbi:MAG: hypothetical protein JSV33_08140 [bacterium]|nr:MAG: hypothetical protein JSV33_08140 [bacterium]
MNTICAVVADSPREVQNLLEKMMQLQAGTGLQRDRWIVDDSGRFGIATSGTAASDVFYLNRDKNLAVAFSGRISNFHKIVDACNREGEDPLPKGYAALVARLYRQSGVDCIDQLYGHFSFIIWDGEKNQLVAFRDHVGSLPLFYTSAEDGTCAIASNIRALIGTGISPDSLNHEAIFHFLYDKSFIPPDTPYEHIKSILPGECLRCSPGKQRTERYYITPIHKKSMNEVEAIDLADSLLREVLEENIKDLQKIGLLFSGGVDSTLLLSMVKTLTDKPIHTYSISIATGKEDDTYVKKAVDYFGTEHTTVAFDEHVFKKHCSRIISAYPTPGFGGWHVYLGAGAAAKDDIECIISGFGGELVFGIPGFFKYLERIHFLLRFLDPSKYHQKALLNLMSRCAKPLSNFGTPGILFKIYVDLRMGINRWFNSRIAEDRLRNLFSCNAQHFTSITDRYLCDYIESRTTDFADRVSYSRMKNFEGSKILGKCNELARCNNVELLIPLMDRRIVEYGFSIPHRLKSLKGQYRYLEMKLSSRYHNFVRGKYPFTMPFDDWLRSHLPDDAARAFDPDHICNRGIFRPGALAALWKEYQQGDAELSWTDIFAFISLDMWLRTMSEHPDRTCRD